eukprot:GHVN01035360.1.p1 GENE.GHVN01035360.1~~GHVN01035360.1.p1  ORF type:complete len:638 (-),score=59.81 GHVN01035360.1:1545-3458(-)
MVSLTHFITFVFLIFGNKCGGNRRSVCFQGKSYPSNGPCHALSFVDRHAIMVQRRAATLKRVTPASALQQQDSTHWSSRSDVSDGKTGSVVTSFVAEAFIPVEGSIFPGIDTSTTHNTQLLCFMSYAHTEPGRSFDILAVMHPDVRKKIFIGGDSDDTETDSSPSLLHNVPVRVHDQCLTGEVFHSLRCDCREQLMQGLSQVLTEGAILLYLQQEGRGIGLANKIAAYSLQESGLDTVDANRALGYEDDLRSYESVNYILDHLGIDSIQLMTNNPRKIRLLEEAGVNISNIMPVQTTPNLHNVGYLRTKVKRMAHLLNESQLGSVGSDASTNHQSGGGSAPTAETKTTSASSFPPLAWAVAASAQASIVPSIRPQNKELPWRVPQGARANQNTHSLSGNKVRNADFGANARAAVARMLEPEFMWQFGEASVVECIKRLKHGGIILVSDDVDRENEGDLVAAAAKATPEMVAYMVKKTSGVLCATISGSRLDDLRIPPMKGLNEDPRGTAFAISVDAADGSTGISATSRSRTVRLLADPVSTASDFQRPGHVFPLRARPGGVFSRGGHTEASVDLLKLAEIEPPVGVIGEVVSEWDPVDMARLHELEVLANTDDIPFTTIEDMRCFLLKELFQLSVTV